MSFSLVNRILGGRSFHLLWCPSLLPKSSRQTMKGLPTRLGCRQKLQYGQECRIFLLVRRAGAHDSCAVTLFKSPWAIYPPFSVLSSSHGQRSIGQMEYSSYLSVLEKPSSSGNALVKPGEAQTIEQLWEEYFADPSQWWDNRVDKRNLRSPDFKQKVTREALWIDGWSTPPWVKAKLELVTIDIWQFHAGYGTRDSQATGQENSRLMKGNNGSENSLPFGARESRQVVQGGGGSIYKLVQSAKTIRNAIAIMKNRLQQGIAINSHVGYVEVLKWCLKQKDLEAAKEVHECIIKSRMEQNTYVANHLLSVYTTCGSLQDARQVFDKVKKKNVFSWTIMIGGYAQHNEAKDAMELFNQMRQEGAQPDGVTYVNILKACASPSALQQGKELHEYIKHAGFESDVSVGIALIQMYAKCGCIKEARQAFEKVSKHNVISWTAMIGAYAESGCGVEAYELFLQMQRNGCVPNAITYLSILNPSATVGALRWLKEVHSHVVEAGLESDVRVSSALIHMYAKSGSIDDARQVFDRMQKRNVITWNVMIGGLAQHGCGREALELFKEMNSTVGVMPDSYSFVAVLSACSHAGLVEEGRRLFLSMSQCYGIEPTVLHYTCMVDLLGRAGHLEEAKLLIADMPIAPDRATWEALLGACRIHGNVEVGELAATECVKLEPMNAATYVLLSNIYAAAGNWEEVSLVRTMMQERGIYKEPGLSWIEVDNKVHEYVVKDRSHPESKEIYAELSRLSKKMKAEGYVPDTQLVLHNIDEEAKELALYSHSEKLALAYGLIRIPQGQPIRVYKYLRVCSDCHTATKFIAKVTKREIVTRDSIRFHHFKDGVCSCDDYW